MTWYEGSKVIYVLESKIAIQLKFVGLLPITCVLLIFSCKHTLNVMTTVMNLEKLYGFHYFVFAWHMFIFV